MNLHRWSRGEKALIFAPTAFLVFTTAIQAIDTERRFRWDVLFDTLNPLKVRAMCGPRNLCPSNLKMVMLGVIQYTQDYDERLPLAFVGASNTYGWADAIYPYTKSPSLFHCPKQGNWGTASPRKSGYTDYYFNLNYSARKLGLVQNIRDTILLGEGNDGVDFTDATYGKAVFPEAWLKNVQAPTQRHLDNTVWARGTAYYAFMDGHVKPLRPEEWDAQKQAFGSYQF